MTLSRLFGDNIIVELFGDGKEGVEGFKRSLSPVGAPESSSFDVIFMDKHMPNMNGVKATKRITRLQESFPQGSRVPIVHTHTIS